MVALSDRLDYIVGAKAASPLDEVFGIRTVDDLLRHYPRSYVEGASMRGADDERPAEGEHITLVDEITSVVERPIRNRPRDKILLVTLGSGRSKVTATFFNPRYLKKGLTKGTKVM
ncbi:MAG: ATP-dependent DNA helicase RecG, partial [Mycobacterium sp.]|nr:ATP-dependent DNA helicase RecG [Mycobacterium sp.]